MTPESFLGSNGEQSSRKEPFKFNVERILIAGNRGPCAGVNMALVAATQVLDIVDGREIVWTNWPVVNNEPIMAEFEARDLRSFDNDWTKVPDSSIVIFSAHGVTPEHHKKAREKNCLVIDTTCLLVTKVHDLVIEAANDDNKVAYIGVDGHPETTGIFGELEELGKKRDKDFILIQSPKDARNSRLKSIVGSGEKWIVYSQTTLMPDEVDDVETALGRKFPDISIPDRLGLCYATYNRQKAVEKLIGDGIDLLLVVGSPKSHNSKMLRRRGSRSGVRSHLLDYPNQLKRSWFNGVRTVGITSGASVLDRFMEPIVDEIDRNSSKATVEYQEQVKREPMDAIYPLPKESIDAIKARYAS